MVNGGGNAGHLVLQTPTAQQQHLQRTAQNSVVYPGVLPSNVPGLYPAVSYQLPSGQSMVYGGQQVCTPMTPLTMFGGSTMSSVPTMHTGIPPILYSVPPVQMPALIPSSTAALSAPGMPPPVVPSASTLSVLQPEMPAPPRPVRPPSARIYA